MTSLFLKPPPARAVSARDCLRKSLLAPARRPFQFGFKERRPLASISTVGLLLNLDSRMIAALIDDGRLRWTFDIRARAAHRREVRVLWQSVLEFSELSPPRAGREPDEEKEFQEVIQLILPPGMVMPISGMPKNPVTQEPVLTGAELARCFSCRGQHILNLINEQTLRSLDLHQSVKASPRIPRSSVVKFLRERRLS
jgi:hypothetical protein